MNTEKQKTILLVEDEAIISMTEKMTIEKYGYKVITAYTGEEAVALVKKTPDIDLILMDINLGAGIDGTEAAKIILQDRNIPLVFLSSHTEPEIVARTEKITAYGFIVKNSSATVFQALIKMVFKLFESKNREWKKEPALEGLKDGEETTSEHRKTEKALHEIEARAQALLNSIPDMLFRVDRQGVLLDYKADSKDLYVQSEPTLVGKHLRDIVPAEFADLIDRKTRETLETGALQTFEYQLPVPGRGVRGYEARMAASGSDEVTAIIRDITESKRAEAALQKSEMQLKAMLENSPVVILLIQQGKLIYMNPAAEKITGWQEKEFIGKDFVSFVHQDDIELVVKNYSERMGGNSFLAPYVLRIIKKSGGFIYTEVNGTVIDLDGKPTMLGFLTDISERKWAEEEVKRQLAEKEILLKEVHHRIKNNIASIGGLLSLHLQTITNPEAVTALQDAIGRVDSMRLLYEKLLLGGDFQDASVKNYIESLAASVVSLFPDLAKVKLNLDVVDFTLDPKRLFPLGIIINELLTNIMKYAFAGKKSGTITLALAKNGSRVTLNLEDNGVGLPSGFALSASKGFGLTLVKMLSQQLGGSFSIETHKGTHCRLEFNV